jgi:hypothetical protein
MKKAAAFSIILIALPVLAQQPTARASKQVINKTVPAARHLTVDDVLEMVSAGLSDDVVVARLRKEDKPFDLSPAT